MQKTSIISSVIIKMIMMIVMMMLMILMLRWLLTIIIINLRKWRLGNRFPQVIDKDLHCHSLSDQHR